MNREELTIKINEVYAKMRALECGDTAYEALHVEYMELRSQLEPLGWTVAELPK